MKKKIIFISLILGLIMALPIITADATITPQEIANAAINSNGSDNDQRISTNDGVYDLDGTIIEINTLNASWVEINLNETIGILIYQGVDHFKVVFNWIDGSVDELIMSIEMYSYESTNTSMVLKLPDHLITTSYDSFNSWTFTVDDFVIRWQEDIHELNIYNNPIQILITDVGGYEQILVNYFGFIVYFNRFADRSWIINFFNIYNITATYIPPPFAGELEVYYEKIGVISFPVFLDYPDVGAGDDEIYYLDDSAVTIAFINNVLYVQHDHYIITIYEDKVVLEYDFICIVIYMTTIIERIVIIFYEFTFIYYFTITELILVIIWETIEIKVYYYQIVIVYQLIEIIILIYNLYFEITINFHINIWIIEIVFIILILNPVIVQPVIIRFIPILVPIFIPLYFHIPVYINQYTYIYVPYLAQEVFIDIYSEVLESPTHTIEYYVYDQADNPILDATVTVDYQGSIYSTTHEGNGVYQVLIPTSNETETIIVTAVKPYYPTATLTYSLDINWTSGVETVTQPTPLSLVAVLISLLSVSIGTMIYTRKRRN